MASSVNLPFDGESRYPHLKLLALDGGGDRGDILLYLTDEIERRVGEKTGDIFTHLAGTSIGSAAACVFALGNEEGKARYSAKEIIPSFEVGITKIFTRTWWQTIVSGGGWWGSEFSSQPLDNFTNQYFKDTLFKELIRPVYCPAFNQNAELVSFNSTTVEPTLLAKDVIEASTAAPTYLHAKKLNGQILFDGGMGANNPTMLALQAFGYQTSHTRQTIISIGTGRVIPLNFNSLQSAGDLQWAAPVSNMYANCIASVTASQMNHDYPNLPNSGHQKEYARLQVDIRPSDSSICDPKDLPYFEKQAKKYIEENEELFRDIGHALGLKA